MQGKSNEFSSAGNKIPPARNFCSLPRKLLFLAEENFCGFLSKFVTRYVKRKKINK